MPNADTLETELLTQMGMDNCDTAKSMFHIGDIPAARAALDAALKNCEMLEALAPNPKPETGNQKLIEV